ncbi:MAG TPA: hypothetical protein VGH28_14035 [Polyangiaceae bacterium]|jgi:hypothetical protein
MTSQEELEAYNEELAAQAAYDDEQQLKAEYEAEQEAAFDDEMRRAEIKARRGGRTRSILATPVMRPIRDPATGDVVDFGVQLVANWTHKMIGELFSLGLP